MQTIRIPTRYNRQLSRLSGKERLWIYDSIMTLSCGENVSLPDTQIGDILELIWRDSFQMENRNIKKEDIVAGRLSPGLTRDASAENPEPEVKGSEVKGSEGEPAKPKKIKHLDFVFLTEEEYSKLLDDFGEGKLKMCIEKLDGFIPNSKAAKSYKDHSRVIRGWVSNWFDDLPESKKPKKSLIDMTDEERFNAM